MPTDPPKPSRTGKHAVDRPANRPANRPTNRPTARHSDRAGGSPSGPDHPDPATRLTLRQWLSRNIDPEMRHAPGLSWMNRAILILIVASILFGISETEATLREGHETLFLVAEYGFLVVFAVEYVARLYAAGLNPRYGSAWVYARRPASVIDMFVIVVMVVPLIGLESSALRMVRALRLMRLARLGRYSTAMRLLIEAVMSRRQELILSLVFATALLVVSSTFLYMIEGGVQPEAFGSIPRAMWWSVATLTTVGYGDTVPVTGIGRFFAAVTALTGVGVIAIPTGLLAGAFADAFRSARALRESKSDGDGDA